ncbi:NEDD8 activating enzyme E1 subunit 1 [Spinellus fusiger]|nr:NEDD8 activating enzyme E1 subunit 1 [Spinellus fusiger]
MVFTSPIVDLKTQRYDRQLRLWATTGQTALEQASLCLLHATSTGCEVLKNLVLSGIGHVTVVDGQAVREQDMQTNFFLEPASIGKPKAKAVIELLQELNEDVTMTSVIKTPTELIHHEPTFFESFNIIIAANIGEKDGETLALLCERLQKTLILVKSKGLVGVFRVQSPEHAVVIETHPENPVDLRLGSPFSQLTAFANSFDLSRLDQSDHGHVPFVILILQAVASWKKEHNNEEPKSYSQRNEIKDLIRKSMRTVDEENFEEAISNIWRLASSSSNIPSDILNIFEDPACINITRGSQPFWIIAKAIRNFVEKEGEGQLPLPGKLPDMKSDTANYVALQKVYQQKAQKDLAVVKHHVQAILSQIESPLDSIPTEMIESFCKNASHAKVIRYRSIEEERITAPLSDKIVSWLENEDNMSYYLVYRAADVFHTKYGRWPGCQSGDSKEDVTLLKDAVESVMGTMQLPENKFNDLLQSSAVEKAMINYVRFADRETANLAALIGGLVSQEAIKLITHQYIPINNTCVFNGITSTSSVFEL